MKLDDGLPVITGGSRGTGAPTAARLTAHTHPVVVLYRS
jgi:NAD(P)-dependent dehydrogenase (short-subunit alcohol dehydrogenase family)